MSVTRLPNQHSLNFVIEKTIANASLSRLLQQLLHSVKALDARQVGSRSSSLLWDKTLATALSDASVVNIVSNSGLQPTNT